MKPYEYFLREYVKNPAIRSLDPAQVRWALDEIDRLREEVFNLKVWQRRDVQSD